MPKIVKYTFMSFLFSTIIFINFNMAKAGVIDFDNDGWSDAYEKKLSADPKDSKSTPDPLADNDLDGLVNEKERDYGTDPTDPDTDNDGLSDSQEIAWEKSDPLDSDTDDDGLNDFNEIINGTNPRFPDSDGDGWMDKAEVDVASDPNNYSSTPIDP